MTVYINESNEEEIGFRSLSIAKKVLEVSKSIDVYCHSREDNYMMQLLAQITKLAINRKYILYDELYLYTEEELFSLLKGINDEELSSLILKFESVKVEEILDLELPKVKIRSLHPIVNGTRIL